MDKPVPSDRGTLDEEEKAILDAEMDNKEFGDAFSQAAGAGGEEAETPVIDDKPSVVLAPDKPGEPDALTPAGDDNPKEVLPAPDAAKPDAASQQPGESDADYKQRYLTLQGIHKHDRESWRIREEELLGEIEKAKTPVPAASQPAPQPDSPEATAAAREEFIALLTPDQQEALKTYEEEFYTVSKMEGLKRETALKVLRKEFSDTIAQFKAEMTTQVDTKIAPALNLEVELDKARHFGSIQEEHPDFETYRDDGSIEKWVETKSKYLQPALKATLEKGSADEIIELLTDFKRENNITTIEQPVDEHSNVVDLKQRRDEKKQNLTSVNGRRGAVKVSHAIADDYESAFDEALSK